MTLFELGEEIKKLRKERGINQEKLAETAGISRTTLSRLENGHFSKISVVTLSNILSILGYGICIEQKNPFARNK